MEKITEFQLEVMDGVVSAETSCFRFSAESRKAGTPAHAGHAVTG